MEPISLGGTFTLERILGTVPVEPDGSAYFEVPALRSLFFVALDENDLSVKRMQSFVNVMPGETTACAGCHEHRTDAVPPINMATLTAAGRRPRQIEPIRDVPEVFDFPRDIQPILDKHCVECHSGNRLDGGVTLSGDRGPWYSMAYTTLLSRSGLVSHGRDADGNKGARGIGSSASRLLQLLDGSHFDAQLTPHEVRLVRLWIDSGAVYAGTYAALGTGMSNTRFSGAVFTKRCAGCHQKNLPGQPDRLFNLTHPERSLALQAPLAKEAGGRGLCKTSLTEKEAPPANVFRSTNDADYQQALAEIAGAGQRLDQRKRFDMPGFRPDRHYVREMIRYGILPETFDIETDPVDVYETDRRYWRSLWHVPRPL
jgi:mono/diheme cytochrome c family protein